MHLFKWLIYKSLQQLYNENSVKIFTYIVVKSHRHIGWVLIILITIMRKERNVLFNDALNTFYLRLYLWRRTLVKNYSDSERGNQLCPLHGLLVPSNNQGSFIHNIPQTG